MSFFDWFLDPVKNHYADFEGRATRKQFWMFVLVSFLIMLAISIVEEILQIMFIGTLFSLAIFIPNIAITARRLHDVNKSGWWQLIALIPIVGIIVLIVWLVGESKNEGNKYSNAPASEGTPENISESQPETVVTEAPKEEARQDKVM